MIVIGYFSYTAIETSIIEIRIGNARIFYASNLKWPKTVKIAEKIYIYIYINTCTLGRTYSVERSIHLIEEH